ncbi:hypothetical protein JHK84_030356 [Glycine max]|uniref:ADP-ribosylation factor n=1 Tax=Glycine max TaxID=3847 RepID=A0A0R0HCK0_SOYBN|nr:hypothetical protein JHK87_030018 [Glycine soja]KAG5144813.1 hypothetical protein JHK84_030356 [Glycine max]
MGLTVSRLLRLFYARKEMRILMVGLDAAGKTTILYKLKLGEIVTTIPTIARPSKCFSVAEITDKLGLHSLRLRLWYIQPTCATSGQGLYEGLDWLSSLITNKTR